MNLHLKMVNYIFSITPKMIWVTLISAHHILYKSIHTFLKYAAEAHTHTVNT